MGVEQALAHLFHLGHAHIAQVLRLLLRAPEAAIQIEYQICAASGLTLVEVNTTNIIKK
jgi:hypothetical protein